MSTTKSNRLRLFPSPPVPVVVMPKSLQENDDKRHQRLHQTKLQSGLFAKPQKPDRVSPSSEATSPVQATGLYRFSSDFRHDVALSSQIFVAQR